MLESTFQNKVLKKRLEKDFPGIIILKNDPVDNQGFPDLTLLYMGKYAILEVKKSREEYVLEQGSKEAYMKDARRHNQRYYVDRIGEQAYANFVYPENLEEIIDDLQEYFVYQL